MIDQKNRNPLVVTGTPALTAGALSVDLNQALTFNGTTNSAAAADSASLSMTGSMSLEFFLKFASAPGSTKDIVAKASSYAAQLNSSRKLLWRLDNGASNVTVTSNATLALNTWYHIICVYNGNYAGVEQFGETSEGSANLQVDDDNGNNKLVSAFTLPELAILDTVNVSLQYADEIWAVDMRAVVYSDLAADPDDLITVSEVANLNTPTVEWRNYKFIPFALTPVLAPAGEYHIGMISDTVAGIPKAPLQLSCETTGGNTSRRPDSVQGPSDPFGAISSATAHVPSIYCDYTAVGRTGLEGKAIIYINGVLDNSANYALGIADNANPLSVCPSFAASVDEISVWNRALTTLDAATHALAR